MDPTTFAVDIDGTLCTQTEGDYERAVPDEGAIALVNRLFDEGDRIVVYTSRYMGRAAGDPAAAERLGGDFTRRQLDGWGVRYHELRFGKPRFALLIDDRTPFFRRDWGRIYELCRAARSTTPGVAAPFATSDEPPTAAVVADGPPDELVERVLRGNLALARHGLVILSEGNVSGIAPDRRTVAIKPSGVPYDQLAATDVAVLDLDGRQLAGPHRPSVDAPTHLVLYRSFPSVGAVVHTHSPHATVFAQRRQPIPCLGTTHADHFAGPIPVARELLSGHLSRERYGERVGESIAEALSPEVPAVLVPGHGPFVVGRTVEEAVENAVVLEKVAFLALHTGPAATPLSDELREFHYARRHGPEKWYGQK